MKSSIVKGFFFYCRLAPVIGVALAVVPGTPHAFAQAAVPASASAEWQAIDSEAMRPVPPAEWKQNKPSREAVQEWVKKESARFVGIAEKARKFYTTHPKDANAPAARHKEWAALNMAMKGDASPAIEKQLEESEAALLADAASLPKDRFEIRAIQIQRKARSREDFEQGVRGLIKEFPAEPQAYQLLLGAAQGADKDRARAIAEEVLKSNASNEVKEAAKGMLKLTDIEGKPLNLAFTAMDGKEIDLQKMKGKVVLVDFWATWCGPCVAEIPNVKAAYSKLRDKGFEIIGVSFDEDKSKLEEFLKAQGMTWPQYFDGKGWQNKLGQEFGIDSIPRMWLVDKKGVLRDMEGRENLAEKVEKLLAEP